MVNSDEVKATIRMLSEQRSSIGTAPKSDAKKHIGIGLRKSINARKAAKRLAGLAKKKPKGVAKKKGGGPSSGSGS